MNQRCRFPQCRTSTGIHDGLTYGWGKLDELGFWEFECPDVDFHNKQDAELDERLARFHKNNHYKWLEKNLPAIYAKLGVLYEAGIISAHGDKCYSYKSKFEEAGIPWFHGVALYLLTYEQPFLREVRETDHGWVDPGDWIVANYNRFKFAFLEE